MSWRLIEAFDPVRDADGRRFLIGGVHPNGVRWVDCCGWDSRGWFRGYRLEEPKWWQYIPDPPTEEEDQAMRDFMTMTG